MVEQSGSGQDDNKRGAGVGQTTQLNRRMPCQNDEHEQATGNKSGICDVRGYGGTDVRYGAGQLHTRSGHTME
eukprot:9916470-Heterocapsa_arctica.AAC.1